MLKYQTNQAASWEHLSSMFKNTDFYLIAYQLKLIISLTQIEVLVKKKKNDRLLSTNFPYVMTRMFV